MTIDYVDAAPHGSVLTPSGVVTAGTQTVFSAQADSSFPITRWRWRFIDGSNGAAAYTETSDPHISFSYLVPGTYTATVTAVNQYGYVDLAPVPVTVHVYGPLTPALTATPDQVDLGTPVQFDGSASTTDPSATITGHAWDFGDGATSTAATPTHTYTAAGTWSVLETVTDSLGRQATASHDVVVRDPAQVPPLALFAAPGGTAGAPTAFDGTGSSDQDGTITAYHWDFGDGTTSDGPTPSHTYAGPGSYTVVLTVTDDSGLTGQVTHDVTVVSPPVAALPTAAFNAPSAGAVGSPVPFDGSSSTVSAGPLTYAWDFGDGATGSGARTSHSYQTPGTFLANLTITDALGRTATVTTPSRWPTPPPIWPSRSGAGPRGPASTRTR